MEIPAINPGERLRAWKAAHWPPKHMRQVEGLPIYIGDHDQVVEFLTSLGTLLLELGDSAVAAPKVTPPRWMRVPKAICGVERLNLVRAVGKVSKRFETFDALEKRCGPFPAEGEARLRAWWDLHPAGKLVAHNPLVDLRAYVVLPNEPPSRMRFYSSGLVLAPAAGRELIVQNHTGTVRRKRSDALIEPLARNDSGWAVFAPRDHRRIEA